MSGFVKDSNPSNVKIKTFYVADFSGENTLTKSENLTFIQSENISGPMGGNTAAFSNADSSKKYLTYFQAENIKWESILSK